MQLAELVHEGPTFALGVCVSLWAYLVHYDRDELTPADAAALARWMATTREWVEGRLLPALEQVGLVERTDTGSLVPKDWSDYHGRFVDWQRREAERKARARARVPGTPAARTTRSPVVVQTPAPEAVAAAAAETAPRRQAVAVASTGSLAVARRSVGAIRERIADTFTLAQAERTAALRRTAMAEIVFAYWAAKMGRAASTLLDAKRESRLVARLRENHDNLSELLYCVDGAARDDFLMGRSPRSEGRTYNGIEQIFRDRGQVERLSVAGGYRDGATHPLVARHGAQGESTP